MFSVVVAVLVLAASADRASFNVRVGEVAAVSTVMPSHVGALQAALPGSFVAPTGTNLGPAPANEAMTVTLHFHRILPNPSGGRITRQQFVNRYSISPANIEAAESFAASNGLTVATINVAASSVQLSGTVAQVQTAFSVQIDVFESADGVIYRAATTAPSLPSDLASIVTAVLGLSEHTVAMRSTQARALDTRSSGEHSLTPAQAAQLYNFPASTGAGECVGIIELGGGFTQTDMNTYFNYYSLPIPDIVVVDVDGATNAPGSSSNADVEVGLDIQIVGALVPAAKIAVYFAPNTGQGFYDAFYAAIHDQVNAPGVISVSWAGTEYNYPSSWLQSFDQLFQAATLLGVTIAVSSGDWGAVYNGQLTTFFPPSSPHILGVGGTTLVGSGSTISSEVTWTPDTGGGVSTYFSVPSYQNGLDYTITGHAPAQLTKRGVPDVAANADPNTGYLVVANGQWYQVGGTSAAAPLWAALIGRINQITGTWQGLMQNFVSAATSRDITTGDNNYYSATTGWDACTGWGSPNGGALLAAIQHSQSPSASPASATPSPVSQSISTSATTSRSISTSSTTSRSISLSPSTTRSLSPVSVTPSNSKSRSPVSATPVSVSTSLSPSTTRSVTPVSVSASVSSSPVSETASPTPVSESASPVSATATTTPTPTRTVTPAVSTTRSATPVSHSTTPSKSLTPTHSPVSVSATSSATRAASGSPSNTHTVSQTPSNSQTVSHTPTNTRTVSQTPSKSHTVSQTPTNTRTVSQTRSVSVTPSRSRTP